MVKWPGTFREKSFSVLGARWYLILLSHCPLYSVHQHLICQLRFLSVTYDNVSSRKVWRTTFSRLSFWNTEAGQYLNGMMIRSHCVSMGQPWANFQLFAAWKYLHSKSSNVLFVQFSLTSMQKKTVSGSQKHILSSFPWKSLVVGM